MEQGFVQVYNKTNHMLQVPLCTRNMRIKTHYTTDGNNRSDYAGQILKKPSS